jgi:glycine cleavage system H lipoate-binding protein/ABC-type phosphate transport system substrate-binding protein
MKNKIILTVIFAIVCFAIQNTLVIGNNTSTTSSVNVVATPDLYNLTKTWAAVFQKPHPEIKVNVVNYTAENKTGILQAGTDLSFVTDEYYNALTDKNMWKMVVGRDAIVPVINTKNSFLKAISNQGVTARHLAILMVDAQDQKWSALLDNGEPSPVHCYILNDGSLPGNVANFLNINVGEIHATQVASSGEMVSALLKDPNALGFCRLTDVLNVKKEALVPGLSLMPIDKNGNGHLDNFENIYASVNEFLHGVWLGKYPAALTRSIYSIAPEAPENENQVAFLKWVLAEGQSYLNPNGYFDLSSSEREAKSALLDKNITLAAVPERNFPLQTAMIILLLVIFAGGVIAWMTSMMRVKKPVAGTSISSDGSSFNEKTVKAPKGLWFDRTHTWAFMEKDGIVRVGIDDFLQHITGPLTRIKMKYPGEWVQKGEVILTIVQNGKQLSICSPVSGTIRSHNNSLNGQTSMLNTAPFTEGWVYTIEPSNWMRETQFMFMAEKYTEWLKQEFTRLKDFFANSGIATGYATIALQDGGELNDNVLSQFGPEVWEEFQVKFIDASK